MSKEVYLAVDRDALTGGIQVSINLHDEKTGGGHGYRLAGPKYCGQSITLKRVKLDARDVREIRSYLRHVKISSGAA